MSGPTIHGQSRASLERERDSLLAGLEKVSQEARGDRDLTLVESKRANADLDRVDEIDGLLSQLPKGAPAMFGGHDMSTKRFASARGALRSEMTYRPDEVYSGGSNFLRDLWVARTDGDSEARSRLNRNREEALDYWGAEYRDMANVSTQGGEFVPPLYLADLWVEPSIAKRPLADRLPKYPMPDKGTAIQIPELASGVSVAARADLGTVSKTDGVTAQVTSTVNEIAGLVDIGRIAVMRSDPGLDAVLGRTLMRRYNSYFDSQLLAGDGTPPQHQGFHTLTGKNTVTYMSGSPTVSELLPLVYEGISKIYDSRQGDAEPDLIVMAPRRAAWLGYQQSTNHPVFQQGQLAAGINFGVQDAGFLRSFAGLEVLIDSNMGTTYGSGTNQDEIIVMDSADFLCSEGPLYTRVHEDVGSGTGTLRYTVFAFSAALFGRYPGGCTIISGTGLATPTWT